METLGSQEKPSNNWLFQRSGFVATVIPVVLTIIGLATAGLVDQSFKAVKARDSQRQQDMILVQKALANYYSNYHSYPKQTDQTKTGLEAIKDVLINLPVDPLASDGWNYNYWSDGQSYTLRYLLEEKKQEKVVFSD